jgi:hypothetical protein
MPDWNRTTKASAVLRKLSLNAAKNWHQKSGANFLDSNKGAGMLSYYCKIQGAPPLGQYIKKRSLAAAKLKPAAIDQGRTFSS